ncbi:MAG TPA: DUF4115 domain-containing protein [Acidimicrobiales bacterium]
MLYAGILMAVVAAALVGTIVTRRWSQDDEHSVEGYHRQLHTLEHISVHPPEADQNGGSGVEATPASAESALRAGGSRTVRVTDAPTPLVPPVPPVPPIKPPPVTTSDEPVTFDDAAPPVIVPVQVKGLPGSGDKAIGFMNRRPRRLAGPALAVIVVGALVVVLLITGSHKVPTPAHHGGAATTGSTSHKPPHHHATVSTVTTTPQTVSLLNSTAHAATFSVPTTDYTLNLAATSSPCWVDAASDATDAAAGSNIFSGVLEPGQQHSVSASGPVTVEVGAPSTFIVTVNGTIVGLPVGYQTPFALHFIPAGSPSSTGTSTTTSTTTSG